MYVTVPYFCTEDFFLKKNPITPPPPINTFLSIFNLESSSIIRAILGSQGSGEKCQCFHVVLYFYFSSLKVQKNK